MRKDIPVTLHRIAQLIYDTKGFNTLALDVRGLSTITDFLLIAEANVERHAISIAHKIMKALSATGETLLHAEGLQTGDWIALDYGHIMIHLFAPGLRERYALERLLPKSKLIDLSIDVVCAPK